MITQILKKEYDKIESLRHKCWFKVCSHGVENYMLIFQGADGKYYKCDQSGMAGTKEVFDFQKELKAKLRRDQEIAAAQTTLL